MCSRLYYVVRRKASTCENRVLQLMKISKHFTHIKAHPKSTTVAFHNDQPSTPKMTRIVLILAVPLCLTFSTSGLPPNVKILSPKLTMRQENEAKAFDSFRSLNRRPRKFQLRRRGCNTLRNNQFCTQSGLCNNIPRPDCGAAG